MTRRTAALGLALAVGLSASGPTLPAAGNLPALGESASESFAVGTERRLGDQIMSDIRRDPDYLEDPVLLAYLNSIWQPLVAAARQRGDIDADIGGPFAWEAFLVRDRAVNAFALPGGFVGINLGLIAMTATRDELASVVAHELSHVTQRHIARSVAGQQKSTLIGLGAMILGILAASRSNNADMAQAAIVGGQAAAQQGQLNFSRDMEREADRMGFGVMTAAGFDSGGMAAMFEKLDLANRLNDNGNYPYLRSHPLTVERMSEARSRILLGGHTAKSPAVHALMRARARVLMDGSVDALRRQAARPTGAPLPQTAEQLGSLYGSVLAASVLRDFEGAARGLEDIRAVVALGLPQFVGAEEVLRLLEGETLLARSDPEAAIRAMAGQNTGAYARASMLQQGQAALDLQRLGKPGATDAIRRSLEQLQTWVTTQPTDAPAWGMLSSCADALGLQLRALRAQAEQRASIGDIVGAIDRLRVGRAKARAVVGQDFIEASIIDARLRQLEGQRRQLAADARGARGGPNDDGGASP